MIWLVSSCSVDCDKQSVSSNGIFSVFINTENDNLTLVGFLYIREGCNYTSLLD